MKPLTRITAENHSIPTGKCIMRFHFCLVKIEEVIRLVKIAKPIIYQLEDVELNRICN